MHLNFSPLAEAQPNISFEDFLKLDIRIGTVLEAKEFPEARNPSYVLLIDFGPVVGVKKSIAQITKHYTLEDLKAKRVAAVVNFPARQIGPQKSEVLTLGFSDRKENVVLFNIDFDVPNGSRLH